MKASILGLILLAASAHGALASPQAATPPAATGTKDEQDPFVVTEVYVEQGGARKLASLSFTRLLTP